jgi:hypothetical protein
VQVVDVTVGVGDSMYHNSRRRSDPTEFRDDQVEPRWR